MKEKNQVNSTGKRNMHKQTLLRKLPVLTAALSMLGAGSAVAADEDGLNNTRLDIYGHIMLDMGYQTGQSDPDWYDVARPTKLPSYKDEYGEDGHFFSGVRQSRLGFMTFTPSDIGEVKTIFEFELFGVGADAGETTFRLRHAWAEVGAFGAGQTWSVFMDPDVFPNSIEYWGPSGMVFYRNVQARWTPWQEGDSRFAIALERPGAGGDKGEYVDDTGLDGVQSRFPMPDLSAHIRLSEGWGHVQLAGILRQIEWDDTDSIGPDYSGDAMGWGLNLSSNLKLGRHVARLQLVYGEGIENYMNDGGADIGIATTGGSLEGEVLPILGAVAFLDLNWNEKWTSTVGYSLVDIDNSDGQADDAFMKGQYALANILYHPIDNLFFGPEIQWIERENFRDGFTSDDLRVQFSVKYNFSQSMGGK